jgi:hypothetical protein
MPLPTYATFITIIRGKPVRMIFIPEQVWGGRA